MPPTDEGPQKRHIPQFYQPQRQCCLLEHEKSQEQNYINVIKIVNETIRYKNRN